MRDCLPLKIRRGASKLIQNAFKQPLKFGGYQKTSKHAIFRNTPEIISFETFSLSQSLCEAWYQGYVITIGAPN